MFKRIIVALESIAWSLKGILKEMIALQEMRQKLMDAAQKESQNAPQRIMDMVSMFQKNIIGGKKDGN